MAATKKFRRPSNKEQELSVITGESGTVISWQLPGGKRDSFEILSADDLLTRKSFKTYREMRADDQVKACLWFKKMLVAGRNWEIVAPDKPEMPDAQDAKPQKKFGGFGSGPMPSAKPPQPVDPKMLPSPRQNNPNPKSKNPHAAWIERELQKLPMKQILWEIMSAFEFGASFGEINWKINDDLKLVPKDVKFRDPEFMHIEVDSHGNILRFIQKPHVFPGSRDDITIPPEKVLHYAYQGEFSNPWGISDLRAAYRAWWSKKYVTQFFNVFLERFGAPLMMMKYPPGSGPELKSALKSIMANLSSKTDILVPDGVTVELIEATRAGNAKFDEALVYYDNAIAIAMLMPALLGMGTDIKRGSDSQSRLHLKTLMKMIQFICEQIEGIITDKIVKPMVDANIPDGEAKDADGLRFKFQDYGEFDSFEITSAIKELHNTGILELDSTDTNYIRSILGMSLRGEDNPDTVERPLVGALPMASGGNSQAEGGGAKDGNQRASKPVSERKTDSTGKQKRPTS